MTGHSPPFLLVTAQIHLASGCTHRVLMASWLTRGRCGMALSDVLGRVEADAEKALETLKEYCRFPTISAHKRAQSETAAFVRRLLAENGFEAREYPTEGGPNVVFGQMIVDERKPTLMMYQHYDVQPVDPLNEWKHDPFDPTIQDGKFWGRGCGDTKGNLIMQLLAVQAWRAVEGRPPINLKSSVFSSQALKGFWGVKEFIGGDNDFELLKHLIYSPTCTICGFVSGYIEQGTKTVNPAIAKAKIDFRLVPNMKQEKQLAKLREHLKAKGFDDIELLPAAEKLESAAISLSARVVKAAINGSVDAYSREPEVWPWSIGASAHGFFNEG